MDKNDFVVQISAATFFKAIIVGLLFVLLYILRDLVIVLLTAVVIASAVEPATRWFGRYKIPRIPAVIFIYVAAALFIGLVFYLFVPTLFNEVVRLSSALPEYVESLEIFSPVSDVGGASGNFVGDFSRGFSIEEALQNVRQTVAELSGGVFQTISSIFGGVLSFLLIVIISFYLSVQERGIEKFLEIITPVKHEKYVIDLWKRSQAKIGKWMQGQLLLGLLIGLLVYLGLTVLGIEYALTLAILAAFAELIPVFGPILAAVPAVLIGFFDGVTTGLMVLGLYVIIQQFENHLIYPLVVRKVVGVPPILVIIALIIGGKIAGVLGIILSVPIAAAILEFTDDIQAEKKKILSEQR